MNPKRLGKHLKIWKDKAVNDKSSIELIFDILNSKLEELEASCIKGDDKKYFIFTNDLKAVYYDT